MNFKKFYEQWQKIINDWSEEDIWQMYSEVNDFDDIVEDLSFTIDTSLIDEDSKDFLASDKSLHTIIDENKFQQLFRMDLVIREDDMILLYEEAEPYLLDGDEYTSNAIQEVVIRNIFQKPLARFSLTLRTLEEYKEILNTNGGNKDE